MDAWGVEGGKRAVKAEEGRTIGRGEGGMRKEVRILDSEGGMAASVCGGCDCSLARSLAWGSGVSSFRRGLDGSLA